MAINECESAAIRESIRAADGGDYRRVVRRRACGRRANGADGICSVDACTADVPVRLDAVHRFEAPLARKAIWAASIQHFHPQAVTT